MYELNFQTKLHFTITDTQNVNICVDVLGLYTIQPINLSSTFFTHENIRTFSLPSLQTCNCKLKKTALPETNHCQTVLGYNLIQIFNLKKHFSNLSWRKGMVPVHRGAVWSFPPFFIRPLLQGGRWGTTVLLTRNVVLIFERVDSKAVKKTSHLDSSRIRQSPPYNREKELKRVIQTWFL